MCLNLNYRHTLDVGQCSQRLRKSEILNTVSMKNICKQYKTCHLQGSGTCHRPVKLCSHSTSEICVTWAAVCALLCQRYSSEVWSEPVETECGEDCSPGQSRCCRESWHRHSTQTLSIRRGNQTPPTSPRLCVPACQMFYSKADVTKYNTANEHHVSGLTYFVECFYRYISLPGDCVIISRTHLYNASKFDEWT